MPGLKYLNNQKTVIFSFWDTHRVHKNLLTCFLQPNPGPGYGGFLLPLLGHRGRGFFPWRKMTRSVGEGRWAVAPALRGVLTDLGPPCQAPSSCYPGCSRSNSSFICWRLSFGEVFTQKLINSEKTPNFYILKLIKLPHFILLNYFCDRLPLQAVLLGASTPWSKACKYLFTRLSTNAVCHAMFSY